MSTQRGFEGWGPKHDLECPVHQRNLHGDGRDDHVLCTCTPAAGDEKLLRYLWEHKHSTPFEMAGATFEIQAPIFVFREWMRHRTQSFSEASARYAPLPDVNYVPTIERLMLHASGANKQAGTVRGAAPLTPETAALFRAELEEHYIASQSLYEDALASGVPKELARVHLPVGRYSRMRASANLRNWLGFLSLRMDPAAQWEIRQFACAVHDLLAEQFPRTLALFDEGLT
jgi:thymidylate synthase (FAD)